MTSLLPDNPIGRTAVASLALLGGLALKYPNRAIFDEFPKGIPHGEGYPLVGALPNMLMNAEKINDFLLRGFTVLDSQTITQSALGMPRTISTINPESIEHILKHNFENYVKGPQFNMATEQVFGHGIFNANGDQWKFQRKTASHIFNIKNFRDHFTEVFVRNLKLAAKLWFDKAAEENGIIDFHNIMFKFTLDSFVVLGFGRSLHAIESVENVPFSDSFDACQLLCFKRFINPFWKLTEPITTMLHPFTKTFNQHLDTINEFAADVISSRKKEIAEGKVDQKDLLSRFMTASTPDFESLNDKDLRDVVLNFIIAGRDTTAQALSWAFFMLLTHSRIENKLLQEIEKSMPEDVWEDPPRLYEAIKDMTYAHAVFYEVLRLYPSVPNNQKFALNDDVWPDGTVIRKGDYVMWCSHSQGRAESVWGQDAKEFRPERWINPTGELRRESQGQWPAFHAGPRVCLGQNLATLQALVVMTYLVKHYKMKLVPGQDITYQVSLTLPMKNGLKVTVEKRQ